MSDCDVVSLQLLHQFVEYWTFVIADGLDVLLAVHVILWLKFPVVPLLKLVHDTVGAVGAAIELNVAVHVFPVLSVILAPVEVHEQLHPRPENTALLAGIAVKATVAHEEKSKLFIHDDIFIHAGELVTFPIPLPHVVTVSVLFTGFDVAHTTLMR